MPCLGTIQSWLKSESGNWLSSSFKLGDIEPPSTHPLTHILIRSFYCSVPCVGPALSWDTLRDATQVKFIVALVASGRQLGSAGVVGCLWLTAFLACRGRRVYMTTGLPCHIRSGVECSQPWKATALLTTPVLLPSCGVAVPSPLGSIVSHRQVCILPQAPDH